MGISSEGAFFFQGHILVSQNIFKAHPLLKPMFLEPPPPQIKHQSLFLVPRAPTPATQKRNYGRVFAAEISYKV